MEDSLFFPFLKYMFILIRLENAEFFLRFYVACCCVPRVVFQIKLEALLLPTSVALPPCYLALIRHSACDGLGAV